MEPSQADGLSRKLKALADCNRIRILEILVEGECCVSHLVDTLEVDQPKVSHHLAILRSAGILSNRRDGRRINYSVRPSVHRRTIEGDVVIDQFDLGDVAVSFRFAHGDRTDTAGVELRRPVAAPKSESSTARPQQEGREAAATGT